MSRRSLPLLLCAALLAGCGSGGGESAKDPTQRVPATGGLRERVRAAATPDRSAFPAARGRTLQQVADEIGAGGPEMALASSIFTTGRNRLAFGLIDGQGQFSYAPTALYVAPTPGAAARGPYVAPADVLLTDGRYRSKQAATEQDPFAAIYAAQVPFSKPGNWAVLAVSRSGGRQVASTTRVDVARRSQDRIPEVGEPAPRVKTDTLASVKGNIGLLDTRQPPLRSLARVSFDQVVGKKPVALLFATPQLCQSRVCGPVVDIAAQLQASYGDRITFIHQEVYVDNDPNKGLREPLRQFNLPTEPWLFVVNRHGTITARLEGSIGIAAFERALKTAL